MIKKLLILLMLMVVAYAASSQNYFKTYQSITDSLEKEYGIPSLVILGIAYHESGGGKSYLAKTSNNHFGIKGKNHYIKSSYKSFDSVIGSYEMFCNVIIKKKFYSTLKGSNDIRKWIISISKCGYASDPLWTSRVLNIIKRIN